jgi:hypothetical protein
MRWVGHVEYMGERKGACKVLVRKSEGKRPLGNPATDWRIILKFIFKKCSLVGGRMDRIDLIQARDRWQALVNVVVNLGVL